MRIRKSSFILILLAAVCLAACGKISEISVTSCKLVSLSPSGLRAADGVIAIGIHNPSMTFSITDMQGRLYHKGKAVADFSAEDFSVEKHSDEIYNVKGHASLVEGVSLFSLLSLVTDRNLEDYTVDVSAKVKAKGLHKKYKESNIPLSSLVSEIK